LTLDEQGWDELSTMLSDLLDRARGIQEQANKRRKRSAQDAIPTTLVLMQFEGGAATGAKRDGRT
jgi:hypothetical protein